MPNDILSTISNWIITVGAIAGAITAVYKLFSPMTTWGKKQKAKKQQKRNEEVKQMARVIAEEKRDEAKEASQAIIDASTEKIEQSFLTINKRLDKVDSHLDKVDAQLTNMMLINAEQTKTMEHMDEKIDMNEIDRLRWEIISFANSLRYDDGQSATMEGYNHVFDVYNKYEALLKALGRQNGKIDNEYAYIKIMFNEFSKNYANSKI